MEDIVTALDKMSAHRSIVSKCLPLVTGNRSNEV